VLWIDQLENIFLGPIVQIRIQDLKHNHEAEQ
jgi:hypothetical protein